MKKIVFALDGRQPLAVLAGTDDWNIIVNLWGSEGKRGVPIAIMDAPEGINIEAVTLHALAQAWYVGWQGTKKETRAPLLVRLFPEHVRD